MPWAVSSSLGDNKFIFGPKQSMLSSLFHLVYLISEIVLIKILHEFEEPMHFVFLYDSELTDLFQQLLEQLPFFLLKLFDCVVWKMD